MQTGEVLNYFSHSTFIAIDFRVIILKNAVNPIRMGFFELFSPI